MRIVIQRVTQAHVSVAGSTCGSIRNGLVVFLGVARGDSQDDANYLSDKLLAIRLFTDDAGKMNRNILEIGGELLIISQFTLLADCHKGRRPSFDRAAPPEHAEALYDYFVHRLRQGPVKVETGIFRADMAVHLVNDGPVTVLIDSADRTSRQVRAE